MAAAGGTILRIQGEESHSGSHAAYAKRWQTAGGGSLLGKGCHPLAAALYLKRGEGIARDGAPIRPRAVVAEVGNLTRNPVFVAEQPKFIQDGWHDVEDWGAMLVTFDDGSVAQITASDAVLGGIRNTLTVYGSRAVAEANLNPNTACVAYAPSAEMFATRIHQREDRNESGLELSLGRRRACPGLPAGDAGLRRGGGARPRAALRRGAGARRRPRHIRGLSLGGGGSPRRSRHGARRVRASGVMYGWMIPCPVCKANDF